MVSIDRPCFKLYLTLRILTEYVEASACEQRKTTQRRLFLLTPIPLLYQDVPKFSQVYVYMQFTKTLVMLLCRFYNGR
jgi:hypothetical protein